MGFLGCQLRNGTGSWYFGHHVAGSESRSPLGRGGGLKHQDNIITHNCCPVRESSRKVPFYKTLPLNILKEFAFFWLPTPTGSTMLIPAEHLAGIC